MTSKAPKPDMALAMRILDHLNLPLALSTRNGEIIHANDAFTQHAETGSGSSGYLHHTLNDEFELLVPPQSAHEAHIEIRTGFRNRSQMLACLKELYDQRATWPQCVLSLIEVERFNSIGEIFGHRIRDALITEIGKRLKKVSPQAAILGHTAEERFALLLPFDDRMAASRVLNEELLEVLTQPYRLDEHIIGIGLFIGFANGQSDDADIHDLVERCYIALTNSRSMGAGSVTAYSTAIAQKVQSHRQLEIDFRKAVERNEIEAHYQPIIDAKTRRVIGFEALARWRHPQRGLLMPDLFVPLAEKTGLIDKLSHTMIDLACREACNWPKDIFLALNLSAILFDDLDIVETIKGAIDRTGFAASRVELEITESVFLSDERLVDVLKSFQAIGMRVVIDDFGTGFSSLSYLRALPFDKIKIDRSFVSEMMISPDARAIVKAITMLAHELGMAIVAEGVENEHQVEILRSFDCDQLQGYLFSKPAEASALPQLLKASVSPA